MHVPWQELQKIRLELTVHRVRLTSTILGCVEETEVESNEGEIAVVTSS